MIRLTPAQIRLDSYGEDFNPDRYHEDAARFAYRLRSELNMSYQEIAKECGLASHVSAMNYVARGHKMTREIRAEKGRDRCRRPTKK